MPSIRRDMQRRVTSLRARSLASGHPCTHSLTHALTHPLTYFLAHPPTHSLTHSLTLSLTHSPTHSPTHSLALSLTHALTHPRTHLLTHPLTRSCIASTRKLPLPTICSGAPPPLPAPIFVSAQGGMKSCSEKCNAGNLYVCVFLTKRFA